MIADLTVLHKSGIDEGKKQLYVTYITYVYILK